MTERAHRQAGVRLAVSMVVHEWRDQELEQALGSLQVSLDEAHAQHSLAEARVYLVYNGVDPLDERCCRGQLSQWLSWPVALAVAPENRGYGAANNQVVRDAQVRAHSDAALVMNPDVTLEPQAIPALLQRLAHDPAAGVLAPRLLSEDGRGERYGCKRYPSLAVLLTRQFQWLARFHAFAALNARYEYRDQRPEWPQRGVELCSGCFMLAPMRLWRELNGFDEGYFMYFEDFDLCERARRRGWVNLYEPRARVRHAGGWVVRKPLRHKGWFIRSALRFFRTHGWRLWAVGRRLR